MLNHELDKADYVRWQKLLHDRGWAVGHWPARYGGQGWSAVERYIFDEETALAGAPWLTPFGIAYAGPVIYTFGSEEQKSRFLPGIRTTDTWWCQGYSEPSAGSDLASLRTRAERKGDGYIVNGQKIWTTMAHFADMMFALVRTSEDRSPQHGISFLLIDMHSPGVTVKPIVSIEMRHHLNEVFFDDVRVPAENLVGEEGKGWTYAKFLLNNERLVSADVGKNKRRLSQLKQLLGTTFERGKPLNCDAVWRRRIVELDLQMRSLESLCLQMLEATQADNDPGPAVSILKIIGSELGQAITSACTDAIARGGLRFEPDALDDATFFLSERPGMIRDQLLERASTIYGGANEVQRDIIARHVLGL